MQNDILSAKAGDKNAFVRLMEQNKLALYRAAKSILNNDDDAADAMQDTVLAAWKNIGALKNPALFKTWLTRICITQCYQILRKNKRIVLTEFVPEDTYTVNRDNAIDVSAAMSQLADNDKLLLTLFYLEDFSIKDISSMLRITEASVRTRLTRARQRFKLEYEKGGQHA